VEVEVKGDSMKVMVREMVLASDDDTGDDDDDDVTLSKKKSPPRLRTDQASAFDWECKRCGDVWLLCGSCLLIAAACERLVDGDRRFQGFLFFFSSIYRPAVIRSSE